MNWTNVKSLAIPVGGTARDVKRVSIGGAVVWEKPSPLPYDSEVEYLESTGTQWINTGVVSSGIDVKCLMAFTDNTVANQGVFGSRVKSGDTGSNAYQIWYNISSNNLRLDWASYAKSATVSLDTPVRIEAYQNGSVFVNGTEYTGNTKTANAYNFYIFNLNQGGALGATGCRAKVYSFQIWQNGVLVRDFIPVRVGTIGYLYDRVSGQLFGNAGTGDFVVGPDVVPVEYIESHETEWIKIPMAASSACDITCDFQRTTFSQSAPFGGGDGNLSNEILILPRTAYSTNDEWLYRSGNKQNQSAFSAPQMSRHTLRWLHDAAELDGTEYTSITSSAAFTATRDYMGLFCSLRNGDTSPAFVMTGRVYSAQFKNATVTMPLSAVRVGNEGAMMDTLTRRIYRNAGTGAFTYGADLPYPIGG